MKKILMMLFCLLSVLILVGCEEENYSKDYVVIQEIGGQIVKGKEAIDEFYEKTRNGEKLKLDFVKKYFEDGIEKTYSFYIKYDGEYYITNYKMSTNSFEETKFKYLIYSEELGKEGNNVEKYEYYCLANNDKHTYQIVTRSWLSAIFEHHINDAIPFYSYAYYKDGFKLGSYSSNVSLDGFGGFPTITFQNSREYSLFYSMTSSYIGIGKYEIKDGYIYLMQGNNSNQDDPVKMAFKIEEDCLIFNIEKSSVVSFSFADGTKFYYFDPYTSGVKFNVNVIDNHGILLEPLKDNYQPGEVVKVKLQFFSGLRPGIMVNDELIEIPTMIDDSYVYTFIMPAKDVTLYTTINGFIDFSD